MAIIGLTDRSPSFKELGRLRLGIPKSEAAVSGPKEIGWFRADFRPDALDAQALFVEAYGQQPTSIHFRLPFAEISRCWDAFYEVYNKFGMLGMADGKRWLYLRHNKTGELLVKDGIPTHMDGTKVTDEGEVYLPFDPKVPVYSYKSKKGDDVQVLARPTGRLRILIPELKRAAYVQIITNSLYNCIHLSEQLAGVAEIAKSVGLNITQVPMTITRRKETISVSFNGHKQMQERYLLNIEIDPVWMEAQFTYSTLMPGATAKPAPQLIAGPVERAFAPEELSEESGPYIDEDDQQAQLGETEQEGPFEPEQATENPEENTSVSQDEYPVLGWPAEIINHLVACKIGVKEPDKVPVMLNRSKIVNPDTPRRFLEMWVNFYCQKRKQSKDETAAADDADGKVANLIAANGTH